MSDTTRSSVNPANPINPVNPINPGRLNENQANDIFQPSNQNLTSSNEDTMKKVSSIVIAGVVIAINLGLLYITFKQNNPQSTSYSFYEMLKQSTMLYLTAQVIGFAGIIESLKHLDRYNFIIIPTVLSLVTFILNIGMGYVQFSSCNSKNIKRMGKKWLIYAMSLIPTFLVFITGYAVSVFDFMKQPFYDILGGGKSNIGYFMAVGFWSACVIWPSVSSVYFILEKHKCQDVSKIELEDVSDLVNETQK